MTVCRELGQVLDISGVVLHTTVLRDSHLDHLRGPVVHHLARGNQTSSIRFSS